MVDLKVGDKVLLKTEKELKSVYCREVMVVGYMRKYCGEVIEVEDVLENTFTMRADGWIWYWPIDAIKEVVS